MQLKNFTLIDVETTGSRQMIDRVIDIGIIRIENGKVVKTFSSLINPGMSISPWASAISGITDADVAAAPMFEEVAGEVEEMFKDSIFVAHNASFDYGAIKSEFKRLGINFKKDCLCSVKLSRALFPKHKSHNLDALIERLGLTCEARHRALPDADVIRQFFDYLSSSFDREILTDIYSRIIFTDSKEPKIDRAVLSELPDTPGIYFFYGKDRALLYVGKSKNIRTRVRSHFRDYSSAKELRLCQETVHVEAQETPGELSALLLESRTIKESMPVYNRALREIKKLVVATGDTRNDYRSVSLSYSEEINPSDEILGIFRSLSQAKQKIRELADDYELCHKLLGLEHSSGACFGSQLDKCKGACYGNESPQEYNERFKLAFRTRRIKTWPYPGGIVIEEKGDHAGKGAVFFVDEWKLLGSYLYENGDYSEFIPANKTFDYDTYKILARYILNRSNRHTIKTISKKDLHRALYECSGSFEAVVS